MGVSQNGGLDSGVPRRPPSVAPSESFLAGFVGGALIWLWNVIAHKHLVAALGPFGNPFGFLGLGHSIHFS